MVLKNVILAGIISWCIVAQSSLEMMEADVDDEDSQSWMPLTATGERDKRKSDNLLRGPNKQSQNKYAENNRGLIVPIKSSSLLKSLFRFPVYLSYKKRRSINERIMKKNPENFKASNMKKEAIGQHVRVMRQDDTLDPHFRVMRSGESLERVLRSEQEFPHVRVMRSENEFPQVRVMRSQEEFPHIRVMRSQEEFPHVRVMKSEKDFPHVRVMRSPSHDRFTRVMREEPNEL